MNWDKGFTATYYAAEVDKRTWHDIRRFEITGGKVSRTDNGLRNSADLECINYDGSRETWVRVWMDTRQEGDSAHEALFTGLACAPDRDINGTLISNTVKCYSVLQPCEDVLLPRGWYAPAGTSAETILRDLLSTTPAPMVTEGNTPALAESIVAEEGENHLTMAEKILAAIGWRMQLQGDGTILIRPVANDPVVLFDPVKNDCIETKVSDSYDWYTAPNVFRAVTDTKTVTFRDESEGPLSIPTRGREIWAEETSCKLNDGESLESYAERRLREKQQVSRVVGYTRRYTPGIYPSDIVELRYPQLDVMGSFYIKTQTISVKAGAPVSEEVTGI